MRPARSVAVEMPKNVAALLPKVRRKPVPLSHNGKTAAVLVSAREYEKMKAAIAEMEEEEEDRYWLAEVQKVREEAKRNPHTESIAERAERARKLMDDIMASGQ